MIDLETILLATEAFEQNDWFYSYVKLIESNLGRKKQVFKTQIHHIIPRAYYKYKNIAVNNSKENLVNLLYRDHILAHYYLALCLKDPQLRNSSTLAITFCTNNSKIDAAANLELIKFVNSLDHIQYLYEESRKFISNKYLGKKRTWIMSEETRKKKSLSAKGKIYVNNGISETLIWPCMLDKYLSDGYHRGRKWRPSIKTKTAISTSHKGKQSTNKGTVWVTNNSVAKMVPKNELNSYLKSGWRRGRPASHSKTYKRG